MFKDYEIGFYGIICSYKAKWFDVPFIHITRIVWPDGNLKQIQSKYTSSLNGIKKQLPKIQSVVFIYGDYKESI